MSKQINKALKSENACFSFKGHDFCCCGDRRFVKKVTRRASRRLNKALSREAA
jgi:hypothetical protein